MIPTTEEEGLTFAQLIPYLVKKYGLDASDKAAVNFSNISASNELYASFKAAYYARFIGRTIDPFRRASCENYAVFV